MRISVNFNLQHLKLHASNTVVKLHLQVNGGMALIALLAALLAFDKVLALFVQSYVISDGFVFGPVDTAQNAVFFPVAPAAERTAHDSIRVRGRQA